MSNNAGTQWRFLVVEDKPDFVRQLQEILPTCVDSPDTITVDVHPTFDEAAKQLRHEKYDVIILDLKDDSSTSIDAEDDPAGLKIFEELKKTRFTPVVFYTALAHKVRSEQTSFVRVVEKTESVSKVKEEVKRVLGTQLPMLTRQLEEVQRSYMWDFVSTHWQDFTTQHHQADVAYLLARRLALTLEALAARLAATVGGASECSPSNVKAHPMIMYVKPPLGPHRLAGDIVREAANGQHWLILTPSCDFAQEKAKHVLLAKCEKLSEQPEYASWIANSGNPSKTATENLEKLIGDNRKSQPERFKFLPGTFFLPDLVADFQQLRSIKLDELSLLEPIATLDSPFAEAVLARFSRYFARVGTPDLDKETVIRRLVAPPSGSVAGPSK